MRHCKAPGLSQSDSSPPRRSVATVFPGRSPVGYKLQTWPAEPPAPPPSFSDEDPDVGIGGFSGLLLVMKKARGHLTTRPLRRLRDEAGGGRGGVVEGLFLPYGEVWTLPW